MAKLTQRKIEKLTKPGRYGDGNGLMLKVDGGSKSWIFRLQVNGQRRDLGLGPWPLVTLERARLKVMEMRLALWEGKDILTPRRKPSVPTFEEAARMTHAALSPKWRNEKGRKVWMQRLEKYIFPHLGAKRVNQITRADVIASLSPYWSEKRETMRKTRQYTNAVFDWCIAQGFIEMNPASALGAALPKLARTGANMRAAHYRELPDILRRVVESEASPAVKLAFQFVVFTACRGAEVRGARWDEVSLEDRLWTIPASRMKAGRTHRVPLSSSALEVLKQAEAIRDESGLIFPSSFTGREISDMTLMKLLHDLDLADKTTIHGLRATFRSWCASAGQPRELAESALSHRTGDATEEAYIRVDMLKRRARLMKKWADFLAGNRGAKVVALRGA